MQERSIIRSKIISTTSYELKLLLRGILLPAALISFFTYVIISIIDDERTGLFNSIPSSVILSLGALILLKLLFYTKLEKLEIHRFRFIFLALICWLIGELIYVYHQLFLGIAVPYPSIADIFYLSATVFLSFHLYSVLHIKKNIIKNRSFLYLGFLASVFPIYLLVDTVYHYEEYYPNAVLEFVVNVSYYVSDAFVIFPCIPILLYSPKNDPFIFHWLLITLSVFILVAADLGYTFNASIDDELLKNIEWLWSFIFSIGYILLSVSILWFNKIKQILEYRKFSEGLMIEGENDLDYVKPENTSIEKFKDSNQILGAMISVTEKAEKRIDILFPRYIIHRKEIIKLINFLVEMTRKNEVLYIRILLPSPKYEEVIPSNSNANISIKYFDTPLSSNEITFILDGELMYVLGSESEDTDGPNRYFIQPVNSESKIQVYNVLFERMWLLEKAVDFG